MAIAMVEVIKEPTAQIMLKMPDPPRIYIRYKRMKSVMAINSPKNTISVPGGKKFLFFIDSKSVYVRSSIRTKLNNKYEK